MGSPAISAGSDVTVAAGHVSTVVSVGSPTIAAGVLITTTVVQATATVGTPALVFVEEAVTVQTTTTVGAPTLAAGSVVSPVRVAATATVGAPSFVLVEEAVAVSAVATVGAPTLAAGVLISATSVSTVATVPLPEIVSEGNAVVFPATINTSVTVGAPTVAASSLVTPNVIPATATVGAPTFVVVEAAATISALTTVGTPTVVAGAVVTPVRVLAVSSVGTPTVTVAAAVAAVTVAATATVGSPTVTTVLAPSTIVALTTVGTPTFAAGVTIAATSVSITTTVGTPGIFAGAGAVVDATVISVSVSVGEIVFTSAALVPALTVQVTTTVGAPGVFAELNALVTPDTITALLHHRAARATRLTTTRLPVALPRPQPLPPGTHRRRWDHRQPVWRRSACKPCQRPTLAIEVGNWSHSFGGHMSTDVFYIKEGDRGPSITTTLLDPDNDPADLTSSTVAFRMSNGVTTIGGAGDIQGDPTLGVVLYDWAEDDTDEWGGYQAEWVVTTSGVPQTFPGAGYNWVEVVPGATTDIGGACQPIDVRRQLGREMTDDEQVKAIHLILALTATLERVLNRDFSVKEWIEPHRVSRTGQFVLHHGPVIEISEVSVDGVVWTGDLADYDMAYWPLNSLVTVTYTSGAAADYGVRDLVAQIVARTLVVTSEIATGAIKSYSVEGTSITYGDIGTGDTNIGRITVGDLAGVESRLRRPVFLT